MFQSLNIIPLTTLTLKTSVCYDYQFTYNLDPLTNCYTKLKAEPETIKQEIIDQSENIDNSSDVDEIKSNFNEEVNIVYDNDIERKHDVMLMRELDHIVSDKDASIDNASDSDDKTTDCDDKLSEIPDIIENVYVDMLENKLINKPFKRQQKYSQAIKTVMKNQNKHLLKRKAEKDMEGDVKDFQEKFVRVVLSEEEMLKARENKRDHHNFKKLPYKCDSCVLGFTRKDTYILHFEKKHDEVPMVFFFCIASCILILGSDEVCNIIISFVWLLAY